MLRTPFCELFDIEAPVLQAAIWPATSPELVAAVSEAGALGTVAAVFSTGDALRDQIERVRSLTERPFVVNHVVPNFDEEAFQATLEARPAAVSFALGHPGPLVERVHAAGSQGHPPGAHRRAGRATRPSWASTSSSRRAARRAARGWPPAWERWRSCPRWSTPSRRCPVLAAGGVADGRGLAAALALGAAGANVGTRFLASEEASTDEGWQRQIVAAESDEAVRFEAWSAIMPPRAPGAYDVVPRVIRTDFVREWGSRPAEAASAADRLRAEIMGSIREGRTHEIVPFAGQTTGLIKDVQPAAAIVGDLVAEAERALERVRSR